MAYVIVARSEIRDAVTVDSHDERRTACEHGVLAEHDEFPGRSSANAHASSYLETRPQTGHEDIDDAVDVVQLGSNPVGHLR